ncbi:hypothetical protein GGC64_000447 [Mycobacterium sp. OAS707]|uniref:hypothetical protein n=1 Tax=Mycobacterium sp. OAS707 TaxID=2663822 RepID=UPI001A07A99A|nr:hypothetical protein [Mycobacterium sp. OAS707]MBE1546439.1 hypothetical protein [Mycobacterium sp. OAS707]
MGNPRGWVGGLMAAAGAIAVYRGALRPWMYRWGATDEEVAAKLPGDELIAPNCAITTRAVTIDAPVTDVWPWLAQIGECRGGFYSYSWLERAAGAHIRNADTVHAELQDLHTGDSIWLARRYGDVARQVVAAVEPNSHLLLMSPDDFERVQSGFKASGGWGFYLREQDGWTRLLVRGSGGAVGHTAFDVAHFVMERKMMHGIRHRAEQLSRDELNAFVRCQYRDVRQISDIAELARNSSPTG